MLVTYIVCSVTFVQLVIPSLKWLCCHSRMHGEYLRFHHCIYFEPYCQLVGLLEWSRFVFKQNKNGRPFQIAYFALWIRANQSLLVSVYISFCRDHVIDFCTFIHGGRISVACSSVEFVRCVCCSIPCPGSGPVHMVGTLTQGTCPHKVAGAWTVHYTCMGVLKIVNTHSHMHLLTMHMHVLSHTHTHTHTHTLTHTHTHTHTHVRMYFHTHTDTYSVLNPLFSDDESEGNTNSHSLKYLQTVFYS